MKRMIAALVASLCICGCSPAAANEVDGAANLAQHAAAYATEKITQIDAQSEQEAARAANKAIMEQRAEDELIAAEIAAQQAYEYTAYSEPTYYAPTYSNAYDNDFKSQGVVYDGGTKYTWYSQNVLPGSGLTELNSNGRTVNSDGYVVDGDGYIAVASSDHEIGTVLETPFGDAKVYDTGCASGTVDVYTDF